MTTESENMKPITLNDRVQEVENRLTALEHHVGTRSQPKVEQGQPQEFDLTALVSPADDSAIGVVSALSNPKIAKVVPEDIVRVTKEAIAADVIVTSESIGTSDIAMPLDIVERKPGQETDASFEATGNSVCGAKITSGLYNSVQRDADPSSTDGKGCVRNVTARGQKNRSVRWHLMALQHTRTGIIR